MTYEFDNSQNQLIRDLAQKMRLVSYFLITMGVLGIIAGILSIGARGAVGSIIQALFLLITGIWTFKACSSFQNIVDTQGQDIENLMLALGELRKLYALQYWLLIITLIFVALALVFGIVLGISNAGR